MVYTTGGLSIHTCAILAAQRASEMGLRRPRQVLWALAGLALGPVALLLLSVRFLRQDRQGGCASPSPGCARPAQPPCAVALR
jgi:hypothetical protein